MGSCQWQGPFVFGWLEWQQTRSGRQQRQLGQQEEQEQRIGLPGSLLDEPKIW